jgi:hypothetical protein
MFINTGAAHAQLLAQLLARVKLSVSQNADQG